MNESDERQGVVRYWWNMAEDSVQAARREMEAHALQFAINRLYYAAFYAVSAALLERNLSFKRHAGVRAALHSELVRHGVLDKEWGRFYNHLFEDRQQGDYFPFAPFTPAYVEEQLERTEEFLEVMRDLIQAIE